MKKNKGYTLIELIIVISIMVILSAMSFVTIGIIKQARYNAAATTLSNQMGALNIKTKALSEGVQKASKTENRDYPLCMKLQYNDSDVTLKDNTLLRAGTYSLILGYHTDSGFVPKESDVVETSLTNMITITYEPETDAQKGGFADQDFVTDENDRSVCKNMYIEFDKSNGSVRYGAGKYKIVCNDRVVATVNLDQATGNHYVK
mgnify:FL=1